MSAPTTASTVPIFSREHDRDILILTAISELGSLHESEIENETEDIVRLLSSSAVKKLVIDLAGREYLGSAMLGAIVRLWKAVATRGGRMAMCRVSERASEIMRISKLRAVWPIQATREEALYAVQS